MNGGVEMHWITLAIEEIYENRKVISPPLEAAIHLLRRVEHGVVKHKTTADNLLVAGEKALHEYNQKNKEGG